MLETDQNIDQVRLNYSSVQQLLQLPSIGRKRATQIVSYRNKFGPLLTVEDLENVPSMNPGTIAKITEYLDWSFNGYFIDLPHTLICDARKISDVLSQKVDLIVTSPPYWQKRDYGHHNQIGQEETPEEYIEQLSSIITSWRSLLTDHGSIFINIGDTVRNSSFVGIPYKLEQALMKAGWKLVNRIIWVKPNGIPEPNVKRLATRHELILQLALNENYYADTNSLAQYMGQDANPGDVWLIEHGQNQTRHLAPFPEELVRRIIHLASPEHVCKTCNMPFRRNLEPTFRLNPNRPQAQRAIELFEQAGLTEAHLKAIRAVGISDAGKGKRFQSGASGNSQTTVQLAQEAKDKLGGYFREFTFSRKAQVGWEKCNCPLNTRPGRVLDPFAGSGTTIKVAHEMGRIAFGSDLVDSEYITDY